MKLFVPHLGWDRDMGIGWSQFFRCRGKQEELVLDRDTRAVRGECVAEQA